jgi:hypothetical protein
MQAAAGTDGERTAVPGPAPARSPLRHLDALLPGLEAGEPEAGERVLAGPP